VIPRMQFCHDVCFGGFRSFADTRANGEVAPFPDLPALALDREVRPEAVARASQRLRALMPQTVLSGDQKFRNDRHMPVLDRLVCASLQVAVPPELIASVTVAIRTICNESGQRRASMSIRPDPMRWLGTVSLTGTLALAIARTRKAAGERVCVSAKLRAAAMAPVASAQAVEVPV
jgi:hypothetical protein